MNKQEELFNQLMVLSEDEDSPFYHIDHTSPYDGKIYRVFSYRIGSYSDFLRPGALECRGHLFRHHNAKSLLVSLPFPKFFNRGENAFTMDLDFSNENIDYIAAKEDGSLITTYYDYNGNLRLKSKTSLTSSMAVDSMELLPTIYESYAHYSLLEYCEHLESRGYTVIMEYVSPKNRIVLPYEDCNLVVLGVRNRNTFELMSQEEMYDIGLDAYTAENFVSTVYDVPTFVNDIPQMKGIEGFVIRLKDGTMVKCKTDEYVSLHHAKDSITAPRRLMDVVLQEASDDLRQMFADDEQALAEIENMEVYVSNLVNHLMKPVTAFYEAHRALERKDFAIKGQQELSREQFSLVMGMYSGKEIDYKDFISRNYKKFLVDYQTTLTVENEDDLSSL